jgi:TatD DNase family protein
MTFTKQKEQLEAVKSIPIDKLLLETDAPFLTPVPYRGKICEPAYVRVTAEFLAAQRGESLETLAGATTQNAKALFNLI